MDRSAGADPGEGVEGAETLAGVVPGQQHVPEQGVSGGAPPAEVVIAPHGALDTHAAIAFEEATAQVPAGVNLAIDMADVEFLGSAALRVLLKAARRNRLVLRNVPSVAMLVLETSGFDRLISVE